MMQQPTQEQAMSQQQQAAAAAQQQMVLCPVRVVYETQILVPPGEQINPNQTFYINPQNQPPWANQNTQIYPQNQMVYLQNLQQNIVPSIQPHMDPNQMYIQQTYPGMQQIIQNPNMQVLAQNLQERQVIRQPLQFANVPPNMNVINVNQYGQMVNMQNVTNIPQNVQNIVQAPNSNPPNVQMVQNQTNSPKPPDVQQSVQNIHFAQNLIQNQNIQRAQMVQQQFKIMQQQIVNAQQNAASQTPPKVVQNIQPSLPNTGQMPNQINASTITQQQQQPHRMVVQQTVRQTFQNVPQPTVQQNPNLATQNVNVQRNATNTTYTQPQHPNVFIRQTATVDPSQFNQNAVNNVQTFTQTRPAVSKVSIPNQNTAQHIPAPIIKPRVPRPMAPPTKAMSNQPSPQARSMPILRTMGIQPNPMMQMQNMTAAMPKTQLRPVCNVASQVGNPPKPMQMSVATETVNRSHTVDNRKRKSESPDEAKHKIAAIEANKATYGNQNSYLVNKSKEGKTIVNDVNAESAHKAHIKTPHLGSQGKLDSSVRTDSNNFRKPATITSQDLNGEKLKRNTVFGQARVRNVSNENKSITSLDSKVMAEPKNSLPMPSITDMEVDTDATISNPIENKVDERTNQPNKEASDVKEVKIKEEPISKIPKEEINNIEIKPELKPNYNDEKPLEKKEDENKPEVKSESSSNALSEKIRNFSGKQIELSHGNIHNRDGNENNYILTHVLDGIVIQESNVAFPIRLPLKERIIPNAPVKTVPIETPAKTVELPSRVLETSTKVADASTSDTEQEITIKLKQPKQEPIKITENKILTISELNLNEEVKKSDEGEDSKSNNENENPLHSSNPQVVKSWTSEELASCLSKKGWHETASILLEHEIDGESLFLVTNAQLQKIGIDENHATILSDFVNS